MNDSFLFDSHRMTRTRHSFYWNNFPFHSYKILVTGTILTWCLCLITFWSEKEFKCSKTNRVDASLMPFSSSAKTSTGFTREDSSSNATWPLTSLINSWGNSNLSEMCSAVLTFHVIDNWMKQRIWPCPSHVAQLTEMRIEWKGLGKYHCWQIL